MNRKVDRLEREMTSCGGTNRVGGLASKCRSTPAPYRNLCGGGESLLCCAIVEPPCWRKFSDSNAEGKKMHGGVQHNVGNTCIRTSIPSFGVDRV